MPRRDDIKKVMIIGSGPIVIGQACEFDYSGTQMRAVGEVMSIGKTYKEALQKSIRSLEIGRYGLGFAKDFYKKPLSELMNLLTEPSSERQFIMYEALRKGASVEDLYNKVAKRLIRSTSHERKLYSERPISAARGPWGRPYPLNSMVNRSLLFGV